ncbi:hypothetical protein HO173_003326 [Letharia columbiana]|uniref:Uncharacterized protein n=1 Tax=Letharia columbiana TaxID=112416 RepID=A0A8H6G1J3_9LECA|nr:uncharacterized protein HO173_003326 [Letharia columbiana]KAF6238819.1 hypothetical protein HO173_003326 [Letharia columbiana]
MLNNLLPFTGTTKLKAYITIFQRLGYSGRQLTETNYDNEDPQAILDAIAKYYKPKGSGLYTELIRQLLSITLTSEGGVRQYEKDFRKITAEIASLHKSLALPEPFLIQLFLIGLGDSFNIFVTTYIQTHELYDDKAVKFDEVIYTAVNKKTRLLSSKDGDIAIYTARNGSDKGKGKQSARHHKTGGSEANRETCFLCKAAGRKFRHPPAKCWTKFSYLKPEKFMSDEEKKKKAQIAAINFNNVGEGPSTKRKRIEEALFNASALGEDEYFNANYAFLEELDSTMYYMDLSPDDFNILDTADNEEVINLIAVDSSLEHNLIATDSADLYSHIVIDSSYSRYSFANRSMFITYEKIYSRPIRGIEGSQV